MLNIGDQAPDFGKLPGVDGETHRLADYKAAKTVVVVFTCNHCPVAKEYEERLIQFVKNYGRQGVKLVAISVSRNRTDRLEKMQDRARQRGFNFPYLFDESQASGRAYGATVTPHLFVLDGQRKIAYMGAFDDHMDPAEVTRHYVTDAVKAVLLGKTPEIAESLQAAAHRV